MRVRLLIATLAVAATPGLALAYCSGAKHDEVTMSCPTGQVFDTETSSCKELPTG